MNPLLDPNVAFLLLVVGVVLGTLALFSPGTGILEIGAVFSLALAGYGVINLQINAWALAVLAAGTVLFILSLRKSRNWILLGASIVTLITGSVFLFSVGDGKPAVNVWLALITSLIATGIMFWVGRRGLEAIKRRKDFDLTRLVGEFGDTRTVIFKEGTVHINGEDWSAWSKSEIPSGVKVRVVGRAGLALEVEAVEK